MIYIIKPDKNTPEGATVINTTSHATGWSRSLSPFIVGPVQLYGGYFSHNVENAWQYSKVYEYYTDVNNDPDERYFKWAQEGWLNKRANRYPMGRDAKPLYSYWDGKKLGYTQARREIYLPLYSNAVKKTTAFSILKEKYEQNQDLYLIDFDGHNLEPGTYNYWDLIDNPNIKFGHAYVLAMLLENVI